MQLLKNGGHLINIIWPQDININFSKSSIFRYHARTQKCVFKISLWKTSSKICFWWLFSLDTCGGAINKKILVWKWMPNFLVQLFLNLHLPFSRDYCLIYYIILLLIGKRSQIKLIELNWAKSSNIVEPTNL